MSILSKLFRKNGKRNTASFQLAHTRGFQQQVVGEASYQAAISKLVGGKSTHSVKHDCIAQLICAVGNKFDANAIEVRIAGALVGYLPRDDAKTFRDHLTGLDPNMPVTSVRAKIVGGWLDADSEGHFGVKLNLKWPLAKSKT